MKIDLLIIIPARSGSKSVPNKNIQQLSGKPLFVHSLNYAAKVAGINKEIYLSTDSEEYASISQEYGYEIPFLRSATAAGDSARDLEFVKDALTKFKLIKDINFKYVAILRPTSPLRPSGLVESAYQLLEQNLQIDSVRAVTRCEQHPYRVWKLKNNLLEPFIDNMHESYNIPRQELPDAYFQSGEIEMFRENVIEMGSVSGKKIMPIYIEPSSVCDIDSEEDLIRARNWNV